MTKRVGLVMLVLTVLGFRPYMVADLTGEWVARVGAPSATSASVLKFAHVGQTLVGVHLSNRGTVRAFEGQVAGDSIAFSFAPLGRDNFVIGYRGVVVSPDSLVGTVAIPGQGEAPFTAVRRR